MSKMIVKHFIHHRIPYIQRHYVFMRRKLDSILIPYLNDVRNRNRQSQSLPVSLPVHIGVYAGNDVMPAGTTIREGDDKCFICHETWDDLLIDNNQRRWSTNNNCGHAICTNCYYNLAIKSPDSINDNDTDDDDVGDPEHVDYDNFVTGGLSGQSLVKNIKCPVCREESNNAVDDFLLTSKWDFLYTLHTKSSVERIETLTRRILDLEQQETKLEEELLKYKKIDVIALEHKLEEAEEEFTYGKNENKDLIQENKTLKDKNHALSKAIKNLSDNIITLKQKHVHEMDLAKQEMTMSTERAKKLFATSKTVQAQVAQYAEQLMATAAQLKVKHELVGTSLEMQLADIVDKLKLTKHLQPLPSHLEDDLKDHLNDLLSDVLIDTSTDAYSDAALQVMTINTSRELMSSKCLEEVLTTTMKEHIATCTSHCQSLMNTYRNLQGNLITLEQCVKASKVHLNKPRMNKIVDITLPPTAHGTMPILLSNQGKSYHKNYARTAWLTSSYGVPTVNFTDKKEVSDYLKSFIANPTSRKRKRSIFMTDYPDLQPDDAFLDQPPNKSAKLPSFTSIFTPVTATSSFASSSSAQPPPPEPIKEDTNLASCIVPTPPMTLNAIRRLDFDEQQPPSTSRQFSCSRRRINVGCICDGKTYATFPLAAPQLDEEAIIKKKEELQQKKNEAHSAFDTMTTNNELPTYFCWSWNRSHQCHMASMSSMDACHLHHICFALLPNGARCRSEKHTFVEHRQFFMMPSDEGEKLFSLGIVSPDDINVIRNINQERIQRIAECQLNSTRFDGIVNAEVLLDNISRLDDVEFFFS
eukprot:Seg3633.3 transcript_id=Seg3633.3/GoldUCD/mRNA.D3Y31 product="hypothetical protein" protein_id=Seg3633.3/GoldUCD/D3Y31